MQFKAPLYFATFFCYIGAVHSKEIIVRANVSSQCQSQWESASERMPPKIQLSCLSPKQKPAVKIYQNKEASWPSTVYEF